MISAFLRQLAPAIRALLLITVVFGLAYPLGLTGFAQVAAPGRADGSLIHRDGQAVGSSLIGQLFTDADGNPLPRYFQSRPSAAGTGYDGLASSASNLGSENPDLVAAVTERRTAIAAFEGVEEADVPPDALTTSASGLDPDISPAYAALQVPRVARERGLSEAAVEKLVAAHSTGRGLGFLGEPAVNVLELNLALDAASGRAD